MSLVVAVADPDRLAPACSIGLGGTHELYDAAALEELNIRNLQSRELASAD